MRQQRHTTAYAPSWQTSGNRAAPHGIPAASRRRAPTYLTRVGLSCRCGNSHGTALLLMPFTVNRVSRSMFPRRGGNAAPGRGN